MKYFPVSRRKPSRSMDASQSALLMIRAGLVVLSKSNNLASCGGSRRRCARCPRATAADAPASAGIADHAGPAADDGDGRVAETLQPRQTDHRQQRADVQAVGGRIEADVRRDRTGGHRLAQPVGHFRHHAAPLELVVRSIVAMYRCSRTSQGDRMRTRDVARSPSDLELDAWLRTSHARSDVYRHECASIGGRC